jgi:hypothetical protein
LLAVNLIRKDCRKTETGSCARKNKQQAESNGKDLPLPRMAIGRAGLEIITDLFQSSDDLQRDPAGQL